MLMPNKYGSHWTGPDPKCHERRATDVIRSLMAVLGEVANDAHAGSWDIPVFDRCRGQDQGQGDGFVPDPDSTWEQVWNDWCHNWIERREDLLRRESSSSADYSMLSKAFLMEQQVCRLDYTSLQAAHLAGRQAYIDSLDKVFPYYWTARKPMSIRRPLAELAQEAALEHLLVRLWEETMLHPGTALALWTPVFRAPRRSGSDLVWVPESLHP